MKRSIFILIGILSLSYIIIFLLAPKDVTDYTVADVEYWRETKYRLLLKTAYDYNDKDSISSFPINIGEWKSFDYRYPEFVYKRLNADILMSRGYRNDKNIIWMDIINSKTGESFHKQKICVEGSGWDIDKEDVVKFDIIYPPNIYTKLYANRLYISKKDKKQIMIYWFMFEKFGHNNSVTMIRLSSPIRNDDIKGTSDLIDNFVENELFRTMYKNTREDMTTAEYLINRYRNSGIMAIMIGILVPLSFIAIGIKKD